MFNFGDLSSLMFEVMWPAQSAALDAQRDLVQSMALASAKADDGSLTVTSPLKFKLSATRSSIKEYVQSPSPMMNLIIYIYIIYISYICPLA